MKGIGEARRLKMLTSSGYKFNAVNNNCVHAVIRVAEAMGISVPVTPFGWYAFTAPYSIRTPDVIIREGNIVKMQLGLTSYGLGMQLRNMK